MEAPCHCAWTRRHGGWSSLPVSRRPVLVGGITYSHGQPLTLSNNHISFEALVLCISLWPRLRDSGSLTPVLTPSPAPLASSMGLSSLFARLGVRRIVLTAQQTLYTPSALFTPAGSPAKAPEQLAAK